MRYDPEEHHRKSIRLNGYDYSQSGAYFVTICTKDHKHYFGNIVDGRMELAESGRIVEQFWMKISNHFNNVHLDEYTIMPNHLHGIIMIDCRGGVTPPHHVEVSSPNGFTFAHGEGRETLLLQQKRTLGHMMAYFKYQSSKHINKIRKLPGVTI